MTPRSIFLGAGVGAMAALTAKASTVVINDDLSKPVDDQPPRRLCNIISHRDYHPSYQRVGVRVDGVERNDLIWYDADRLLYRTTAHATELRRGTETRPLAAESIEPFWRYAESRQQRRARERWERTHR